jgi:TP901 family phage tail tape measure protein
MTIDVSLRLRLQNQLSKDAKVAERDLKDLRGEAQRLGSSNGADKLGKNIRDVGRAATQVERPIRALDTQARKLNTITTAKTQREIQALGTAALNARRELNTLAQKLKEVGSADVAKMDRIHTSAGKIGGALGLIGATASGAFAGLVAFASVDNIVRGLEQLSSKFRDLNREVASVAVTAEMRTPEAMAQISKSNERLAIRYGYGQKDVNDARKVYAAAGIDLASQENVLDPTLKAAKAGDSTGGTIASAVISAKQNMGVKDSEIPTALDMMAKGSKLGRFEVDAMAKNFPALGTMLAGTGREGLQGWAELVALSQVVRMGAGSQEEAATNLQNLLSKVTSKDTVKNFDEAGVSLPDLKARADKEGKPYLTAVMDEVMRLTGGDQFKIGELFGDQQAGLALKPLLSNRETYESFLSQILNDSAGSVDKDYKFLKDLPKERADRRGAALEATGMKLGDAFDRQTAPLADRAVRFINPDYNRQRTIEEEPELLKQTGEQRLQLENELLRLQGMQRDMGGGGGALGPQINRLREQLNTLTEEEGAIIQNARDAAGKGASLSGPAEKSLGADLGPAADQAMSGYNATLGKELDKAVAISAEKAGEMQRVLNFTAQPTIQPNFLPPAAAPASPAPGQQSSLSPANINQTINSPNAMHAGRQSARNIQRAQARTLYDTGRRPA